MSFRKSAVRRRTASEAAGITPEQVYSLLYGFAPIIPTTPWGNPPFRDRAHEETTWRAHRDQLVAWWTEGVPPAVRASAPMELSRFEPQPGTRPAGWWKFDGNGIRRRLAAVQEFDPSAQPQLVEREPRAGEEAELWARSEVLDGAAHNCRGIPSRPGLTTWESEAECLARHELLTAAEAEALA